VAVEQELRNALYLAQYQSAREVVVHARQIQHSIVSWSSASAGVLLGSGAVLASNGTKAVTEGTSGIAFLLLFSVALPGLVGGSFNAWIGEVARMRRAASFVRDMEYSLYRSLGPGTPPTPVYDTVVSRGPAGRGDSVTRIGRRAVAMLHLGLLAMSVGVASASLWAFDLSGEHTTVLRAAGQLLLLGMLGWFIYTVWDGFRTVAPYASHTPTHIDDEFLAKLFGAGDDPRVAHDEG